jgi:uncharacterized protein (DUF2336 family)
MAAPASKVLIADLENAVQAGSSERRTEMLRKITDLFMSTADLLNEAQVDLFDDVLLRLIARTEEETLSRLSTQISPKATAPKEVIRRLARHEKVSVAGPVLAGSSRLTEQDLLDLAAKSGPKHLLAISTRKTLNEAITDELLKRGFHSVSNALVKNNGARFSNSGYAALVDTAEKDDALAVSLGTRPDLPEQMQRDLLSKATSAVRIRLLKAAPPAIREKIQEIVHSLVKDVAPKNHTPVDYTQHQSAVLALNRAGKLGDQTINRFAIQEEYPNIIAALALLSTAPIEAIEPLVSNDRPDGLIVACKAARLNWSTTLMVLRNRPNCRPLSKQDTEDVKEVFETLSLSSAQQTITFWSARAASLKTPENGKAAKPAKR